MEPEKAKKIKDAIEDSIKFLVVLEINSLMMEQNTKFSAMITTTVFILLSVVTIFDIISRK